ncbi:MAG: type III restriction-modification system endonuclease [Brachybacterium tyrofermentans]
MKLQFKHQQYQSDAVDAVVDCFAGQPRSDGISYRMDPGVRRQQRTGDDSGFRNAEIALSDEQLLENIRAVQLDPRRNLSESTELKHSGAASAAPNLDIEMETGTGKTYVYIKTIMELHRRYGWGKYIVVVPSVAIREGVMKTFQITGDHFQQEYGTKPRAFVYNSSRLHELEAFSSDAGVQVMIINIQAFNATGKDNRRIYDILDDFQSRRPIDVIAANRPIVIIDEPQRLEGTGKKASKSLEALAWFQALFVLRYSATHKVQRTLVHRLDAVDAYNQKLVKRIAVRGITVKGLAGTDAYLYLDSIQIAAGRKPRARMELEVQAKSGAIARNVKLLDHGSNLHDASGGLEAYRGLFIRNIDAVRDIVELSNGDVLEAGQLSDRASNEETKRRIQIREVIAAHLAKERMLHPQGIKVLSLFFIDEVAKYRDYGREDTLGDYARIFEEEYTSAVTEMGEQLALDDSEEDYLSFLDRDIASDVHAGYFSIDKKTSHLVDPKVAGRGEDKGLATDKDAYDLILRDKERLLSQSEPVRFLFSHSALREGWDNPNVFTMGMLKKSDNTISRRQEIGRGLRLAVDQSGERIDHPSIVHDVNELTVVSDESYTEFVTGLQKEITESLTSRPRKATAAYFTGKALRHATTNEEKVLTEQDANLIHRWLIRHDFIDQNDHLTEVWHARDELDPMPALPDGLDEYHYQIADLIDALHRDVPIAVDSRRGKQIPLNECLFHGEQFQGLWQRIRRRGAYQVNFDSKALIDAAITALNSSLHVTRMTYTVNTGVQKAQLDVEDLDGGRSFTSGRHRTLSEDVSVASQVQYDVLAEITERTHLTRHTVGTILSRIEAGIFAKLRQNPEQFLSETARLINECKAELILENLTYSLLEGDYGDEIFTADTTKHDFTHATPLTRHIYEYAVTDSQVERDFYAQLEQSDEVAVYAKLPHGFLIPTPVGDYNPDWAIVFQEGTVKHVYFVAETKSTHAGDQRRVLENAKITAARKFFHTLNSASDPDVTYDVATDYDDLVARARS